MSGKNLFVIIRSAHERTEDLCVHLVQQQILTEQMTVIHERPFTVALRRSFEIGIEAGLEWTLCIDADVLVRKNAIIELIEDAAQFPSDIFSISGYVYDKFLGERLPGGLHLYRTTLLPLAITHIPGTSHDQISNASEKIEGTLSREELKYSPIFRPETYVKGEMKKAGYDWGRIERAFGLHDYEQYYKDIYRKMVVRSRKSPNRRDSLLGRAIQNSRYDTDFLVANWGIRVGIGSSEHIHLDANQWKTETEVLLLANNIMEKSALSLEQGETIFEKQFEECVFTEGVQLTPIIKGSYLHQQSGNPFYALLWRIGRRVSLLGISLQRFATRKITFLY